MKASALKYGILSFTAAIIVVVLLIMPFHAFFTVWLGSNIGHYTAVRLWKEVLLALAALGALYLIAFDKKVRLSTLYHELTWLIVAYMAWQLIVGLWALHNHNVSAKALAYGLLINTRFLVFFLVAWVVGTRTKRINLRWSRLLIWPAIAVVAIGLLQAFVLPTDFLRHFGYNDKTIYPYETINHNANYIRVMSTLRGANPLGAYLLVPFAGMLVLMTIGKRNWRRWWFLATLLVVLFFSFSRAAWIGAGLVAATVGVMRLPRRDQIRAAYVTAAVLVVLGGITVLLRHNIQFQNIVFHTQEHSAVASSSNNGHLTALKAGVHDMVHEPFGAGPGTAGPASVYNNHPARIAENYYLQIGQETGWLGLAMFLSIIGTVGYLLWKRRTDPLALTLLASLVGISFVSLLSHAWTDDTLAYIWWGLAGIAIGTGAVQTETKYESKLAEPKRS